MYVPLFRDVTFRNPHCALCHGETADSLICLNLAVMARSSFLDDFKPISFAVLFDFDRADGEQVAVQFFDRPIDDVQYYVVYRIIKYNALF